MVSAQPLPFLTSLPLVDSYNSASTPVRLKLIPENDKKASQYRNKLMVGKCGSGVGFLTKYMLLEALKGSQLPHVLFLDESNNFHLPRDYSAVFAKKRDAAFHLHRMGDEPYLPGSSLPGVLPAGVTLVKIDYWWHTRENIQRLLECLNEYLVYFIDQCVKRPERPHILVLDRYWPIILSKQGGSLWHLFRDLIGTLQTHLGEVWLQTDDIHWIDDLLTHEPVSRQRWQALQDLVGTKMLLQHSLYGTGYSFDKIRRIYRMSLNEFNQLVNLNHSLKKEASYKEVLIRQAGKQAVYGVKAEFEIQQLIS